MCLKLIYVGEGYNYKMSENKRPIIIESIGEIEDSLVKKDFAY